MSRFMFTPRAHSDKNYVPHFLELIEKLGELVNLMSGIEGMLEEKSTADELGLEDEQYDVPDNETLHQLYKDALDETYAIIDKMENGFELAIQALFEMYTGALLKSVKDNEPMISLLLTARIILNVIGNITTRHNDERYIRPVY